MKDKKLKLFAILLCMSIIFSTFYIDPTIVKTDDNIHPTKGYVMKFDNPTPDHKNNQHVRFGTNLYNLGLTDTGTIEAWVKVNDTARNNDIISDWAVNVGLTVRVTSNIEGYVYPGDYRIGKTDPPAIASGEWHHIAFVLDKDVIKGYVDGVFIKQAKLGGPIGNSVQKLKLGCRGDFGNKFDGYLSDVRIWNVVRTEQEIKDNKDRKLTGKENGLVAYWKLDEESGDVAKDSVGNNDGIVRGATRVKEPDPTAIEIVQGESITIYKDFMGQKLTSKLIPEGSGAIGITWSSSDENIVKVEQGGALTAVSEGTAKVEVVTGDGKLKDSITVTVKNYKPAKSDYTFVILPDTQYYASAHPAILESVSKWIKDNAEKEKIKFMFQVGDITDDNSPAQWQRAKQYYSILDGVVPYAVTIGNHDYAGVSSSRSTRINEYFPVSDFEQSGTYGGVFEEGKIDNVYHLFKVGDVDYLVITLEFGPRNEVLEWANSIAEQYPNHRVIVVTHCYMNYDGKRVGRTTDYTPYVYPLSKLKGETVNDGEDIWKKLVSKHKNMFMVLSGHIPYEDVVTRVDEGVNGNKVMQILADPQWYGKGGEGLILLMRFNEKDKQISFNWYSPTMKQYFKPMNQFTVNLETKETEEPVPNEDEEPKPTATNTAESKDTASGNTLIIIVVVAAVLVIGAAFAVLYTTKQKSQK